MGKIAIISKYKSEAVEHVKENKLKAEDVVYVCLPQDLEGVEVDEAVILTPPWYGFDKDEVLAKIVKKGKKETPPPAKAKTSGPEDKDEPKEEPKKKSKSGK